MQKFIWAFLFLFSFNVAQARFPAAVDYEKIDMTCPVVSVTKDSPFDEGLEAGGDEDYSEVRIISTEKKKSVRIGGFTFGKKKVTVTESSAKLRATVNDKTFGSLLITYDYTNGRGYVYLIKNGKEVEIAKINCVQDMGLDPFAQPNLGL